MSMTAMRFVEMREDATTIGKADLPNPLPPPLQGAKG